MKKFNLARQAFKNTPINEDDFLNDEEENLVVAAHTFAVRFEKSVVFNIQETDVNDWAFFQSVSKHGYAKYIKEYLDGQVNMAFPNMSIIFSYISHPDGEMVYCFVNYFLIGDVMEIIPITGCERDTIENTMSPIDGVGSFNIETQELFAHPHSAEFDEKSYNEVGQIIQGSIAMFLALMSALKCNNVYCDTVKPSRLKNKIAKQKNLPTFEYRVLCLKQNKKTINRSYGGTHHASPRVHLRRGHIRRLPNGESTWVNSCVVGDKSQGTIKKDYVVM